MLGDDSKELFGNTLYTKGDVYKIRYTCNHHDFTAVLKNHNYTTLIIGTEVQFIGKVSKLQGVFARVRNINTNITYDIEYTNLGELSHGQEKEDAEIEAKRKAKRDQRCR